MSDITYQKSKLVMLVPTPTAEQELKKEDELSIDPLADINLFSNKISIKQKQHEEPIKQQEEQQEEQKEPVKKRVLTDDHKEKLRLSRLKGLETRRRNRELKKQQKLEEEQNKININQKYEVKEETIKQEVIQPIQKVEKHEHEPPVQKSNYNQLEQVKKILHTPTQRHVLEKQQYNKPPEDPDQEFKKFYTMMNRYERIRNAQLNKRKQELLIKQKEEQDKLKKQKEENDKLIKQQQIQKNKYNFGFNKFNGFNGFNGFNNKIMKKPIISNNSNNSNDSNAYLHYFQ
tara:strand:- start:839 stop:1702 length:864 start_codon:yes stop_codon:yes gene_type:complete